MTGYWGTELTRKATKYYKATVSEEIAPVVAERCGGNQFYITAVIKQAAKLDQAISDEESLNTILAVDLSSGFIRAELNDQVTRWIERINDYGITKWILYLSALEEGDELDIGRIQPALLEREGKEVSTDQIWQVLIKLSRGDLLDYMELGGWFRKVQDPILLEFLKVWGWIEVERQNVGEVIEDLRNKYSRLKHQISDLTGYLAEVYMAQILLNAQQTNLPGHYFHQKNEIEVPRFSFVRLREQLGAGTEIDVHGAAGIEQWWPKVNGGRGEKWAFLKSKNCLTTLNWLKKIEMPIWFAPGFSAITVLLERRKLSCKKKGYFGHAEKIWMGCWNM